VTAVWTPDRSDLPAAVLSAPHRRIACKVMIVINDEDNALFIGEWTLGDRKPRRHSDQMLGLGESYFAGAVENRPNCWSPIRNTLEIQ
jgi:hypothetical protein